MDIFKSCQQLAMLIFTKLIKHEHVHYETSLKFEPTKNNNSGNTLKPSVQMSMKITSLFKSFTIYFQNMMHVMQKYTLIIE